MRVAGVDIARGAWLVVWMDGRRVIGRERIGSLGDLSGEAAVVAVDVPLDLPVGSIGRRAEEEARRMLGARSSTVFASLPLTLYEGAYTVERREEARRRFGRSFSKQSWNLRRAVLDARSARGDHWIETHPELAFARISGGPLPPKRTGEGVRLRIDALESVGISAPPFDGGLRADDVLDATVCAYVAGLHATNSSVWVPSAGPGARIHY